MEKMISYREGHWRTSNRCHWAHWDAIDGHLVECGTDWSTTPTQDEIEAWRAEVLRAIEAARALPHSLDIPLYIRFGRLPRGGRSLNHASGRPERGISCYRARWDPSTGLYVYDDCALSWAAMSGMINGRSAYLLTGKEVGAGSDGEPVIKNVHVIGRLEPQAGGFVLIRG